MSAGRGRNDGGKRYAVWIEIEEQDEANDTYETLPLMKFGSTAVFDTEDEAIEFAVKLHDIAPLVGQLYCQHGKPDNPGPCPYCVGEIMAEASQPLPSRKRGRR